MGEPALLFGLGATRAGTSWLHRYLDDHPQCHFRAVKELHYFDVAGTDTVEWWIAQFRQRRGDYAARAGRADLAPRDREIARRHVETYDALIALLGRGAPDDAGYLALLREGAGEARVLGDITPAYGLVPEEVLARMQALAPRTRFVYILREPVARLWSNIRQVTPLRRNGRTDPEGKARLILDRFLRGQEAEIAKRCDYAGAVGRILRAIRPENRLFLFFEDLFSEATVRRVTDFLGLDYIRPDFGRRIHEGIEVPLDPARAAAARRMLAPQYDFVRKTFGAEVPARWMAQGEA
jgi:hypothetical protein